MSTSNRSRRAAEVARQRRNRWLLWGGLAVVVAVAAIIAVVASGGDDNTSSNGSPTKFQTHSVASSGTTLPTYDGAKYSGNDNDPAIGKTIPTLTGVSVFDGKPITVQPTDKPQMVVFVAHWCPHCRAEVPRLVSLANAGVFDGVDVTAVATGTNAAAVNYPPSAWLQREHWPFAAMADSAQGSGAEKFGISAYPYFVLVNADGTVAARATGEVPPDQIKANIEALEAGKPLPLLTSGAGTSAG